MAQTRLKDEEIEPCGRAAQHGAGTHIEGEELRAPNGRTALLYDGLWVGQHSASSQGRSSKASKKEYVLLRVTPKEGGGFDIQFVRVLDKKVVDELSLNKKIHGDKSLRLFPVPGNVRGGRCQLITL